MKIEQMFSAFHEFMKSIIDCPFLDTTYECDDLYVEFTRAIFKLQDEGYNYIYKVYRGVEDGYSIGDGFVLTRSYIKTSAEMRACDYYELDDKFYDLINFVGIEFPYTFSLNEEAK